MRNMRRVTRLTGWHLALVGVLMLSLASCTMGKRKQEKERAVGAAASRFQLGSRYLQDGEIRRALNEYSEAARLQPKNARYQNGLGQAYFFLREYDLSEEHFLKALKINPAFSEAQHNLALTYSERGDYPAAEKAFMAALKDPAYFTPEKVYLNWGTMLHQKGDIGGAEEKMRAAVEVNPRYARGYQELGRLLEEKGQDTEALENYLKAYPGMSERAGLNLKIGELYLRQGKGELARRFLQKVVDTAPPDSSEALRAQAFLQEMAAG